jgi:ATP-dependent DNA helicase RecG
MRDERLFPFFASLTALKGLGPKLAPVVARLVGGDRVGDMLFHLPERWLDRRLRSHFDETCFGEVATVGGAVQSVETGRTETQPARVRLADETGFLTLVYFRANPAWLRSQFPEGARRVVSGQVDEYNGERQIVHPDHVIDPATDPMPPEVEPIYRLSAGLTNKRLHGFQCAALATLPESLPEWGDAGLVAKHGWPGFIAGLHRLHAPEAYDEEAFAAARARLAHDEALARELVFQRVRASREAHRAPKIETQRERIVELTRTLPFRPTDAQFRAAKDIANDMAEARPMRRMVQGDVGSGKTLVAAFAALQAADAGYQTAVMAPTEVLARQQYQTLKTFLSPMGIAVASLTGRDKGRAREAVLMSLADGSVSVAVGTHALFQDTVAFRRLGLIIVDEQHRFGVSDRARLVDKGAGLDGLVPHTLVMSATPIPRTLAMAVHGDVDMSILDEKPAGRKPVVTVAKPDTAIEEVLDAVGRAVARGEQAFWICPRVDADDDEASAVHRHASLKQRYGVDVALVHGRLKPEEKDRELERFRTGAAGVLVATTVVEVGVDVPNATIMVIERAEGFGLAQLHQLRGRVGRGDKPAYCLLLYRPPLSEGGKTRIETLRETDDGFAIAEADFRLRGPGDLLGLKQSGLPDFRVLRLPGDAGLLRIASDEARLIAARGELRSEAPVLLVDLLAARQNEADATEADKGGPG